MATDTVKTEEKSRDKNEKVGSGVPYANDTTEEVPEIGGQAGGNPVRYGEWQKNGRVTDF